MEHVPVHVPICIFKISKYFMTISLDSISFIVGCNVNSLLLFLLRCNKNFRTLEKNVIAEFKNIKSCNKYRPK